MVAERSRVTTGRALLRSVTTASLVTIAALAAYYLVPIQSPRGSALERVLIGVAVVIVVLAEEVRAILRHDRPIERAIVSFSIVIPLFVVVFAWVYLTMARSDPAAFGEPLSRTAALYFTVTVLTTVGFGDIAPRTDPARIIVMIQMVADVILLAIAARLIYGAARRRSGEVRQAREQID